jgi:hypothetical protein
MPQELTDELDVSVESAELASQSQIDKLVNRIDRLLEHLDSKEKPAMTAKPSESNAEPKPSRLENLLKSVWGIVVILLAAGGIGWTLHSEFAKVGDRMGGIDGRMARLETAIRILSVAQGGNTKELVDEALKVAQFKIESGNAESAKRVLAIADRILAENKAKKVVADPTFFAQSITRVRNIRRSSVSTQLTDEAFKTTMELAEYRSALTTPPTTFHPQHEYGGTHGMFVGELELVNGYVFLKDAALYGPNAIQRGSEGGFLIDGCNLEDVVLSGLTIHYHGGRLILHNVWFVNCNFIVDQSQRGNRLLEVAALGEQSANIS